jgi:hypothetical protein
VKKRVALVILLACLLSMSVSVSIWATGGDSFYGLLRIGQQASFRYVGGDNNSRLFVGLGMPSILFPPSHCVATAVTGNEINLSWFNANTGLIFPWPNLKTVIRMKEGIYPDDPPSLSDNSSLVYEALAMPTGAHQYAVLGLTPGITYYFRIWFYDPVSGYTSSCGDFATPQAGTDEDREEDDLTPPNWFSEPTCDSWENVPGAMVVINGIEDKYGFPTEYLCLFINLFLLSCAMTTSYGGMAVGTRRPTGTQTILVPFIVMVAGFIIGPTIGAFPGFFLAIGVIIGIGVAFAWSRA